MFNVEKPSPEIIQLERELYKEILKNSCLKKDNDALRELLREYVDTCPKISTCSCLVGVRCTKCEKALSILNPKR